MEIIEALLEKEPNYLAGYKLKLFLLSASSLSKEDNFKDLFHETFEEAKALNPNDPDLKEMELANKGNIFKKSENNDPQDLNNSKEFIAYLESESAKHPKEWIYDYYKANVVYNNGSGNYQEALILIENAIKKDPKNTRLKLTLENLKSEDESKRKHPFIITLGFSLDDL